MAKTTSTDRIDRDQLAQLCREHGIVFAGLFGSEARGEASSESDIDLLVRFDGRRSLVDLARVERELGESIGHSVDLITENALSPYLREQVMTDLEVIVDDE